MIELLLAAVVQVHGCTVPSAAYIMDRDLRPVEYYAIERYEICVCGTKYPERHELRKDKTGRYYDHPICKRRPMRGKR